MAVSSLADHRKRNIDHWEERTDLACAFRWAARLNMHEAVANHFSLAVNEDGTRSELDSGNLFALSRFAGQDRIETGPRLAFGATWTRSESPTTSAESSS